MPHTIVIPGHLVDARTVELESPAPTEAKNADVLIRVPGPTSGLPTRLSQILRQLPPGCRTRADIDRQMEEERSSWDR